MGHLTDTEAARVRAKAFEDAGNLLRFWAKEKPLWTAEELIAASWSFSNEAFLIERDLTATPEAKL
jgi:hypothetical protein